MMVPQLKVDKQQLNDTETVTSAEVPSPVGGKCVIRSCMLTNHDELMIPQPLRLPLTIISTSRLSRS